MKFLELILQASPVVKFVLLVLLFFSVFSWAVIFFKRNTIRTASAQSKQFLSVFRKSRNLTEVSEAAQKYRFSPLATLFLNGFKMGSTGYQQDFMPMLEKTGANSSADGPRAVNYVPHTTSRGFKELFTKGNTSMVVRLG